MQVAPHSTFALSKGYNASKPLNQPCPNCFVLTGQTAEHQEILYWVLYMIWKSKSAQQVLVGSVIQFIRKNDLQTLINQALDKYNANPAQFTKLCKVASAADKHIANLAEQTQKLNELKQTMLLSFIKS